MISENFPIGDSPLFPAPHIKEAVPHNVKTLQQLLETRENDVGILFALANLSFYENCPGESLEYFRKAIAIEATRPELFSNQAIVLYSLQRIAEARKSFEVALELDSEYEDGLYYFAHLHLSLGAHESAKKLLKRLTRINSIHVKGLALLGYSYQEIGETSLANNYYRQVYSLDPTIAWVKHRLCKLDFKAGKEKFEEKELIEAFKIWSKAHELFKPSFISDKEISKEFKKLRIYFNEKNLINPIIDNYKQLAKKGDTIEGKFFHQLFCQFYFSVGLFPDFYLEQDKTTSEQEFWNESLETLGQHPFANFKIAVALSYEGKLEEALRLFRLCEDTLLPKKQESLSLGKIVVFIKMLLRLPTEDSIEISSATDEAWLEAGWKNKLERNLWKESGFEPKEAKSWAKLDLLPKQAREWRKVFSDPELAKPWLDNKIEKPKEAKFYLKAEITPKAAKQWARNFTHGPQKAVQCYNAGLKNPEEAEKWLGVFTLPWEAARWADLGLSPEEAAASFREGVSEPYEAKKLLDESKIAKSKDETTEEESKPDSLDSPKTNLESTSIE